MSQNCRENNFQRTYLEFHSFGYREENVLITGRRGVGACVEGRKDFQGLQRCLNERVGADRTGNPMDVSKEEDLRGGY